MGASAGAMRPCLLAAALSYLVVVLAQTEGGADQFQKDFKDADLNNDQMLDVQEVRLDFKGELSDVDMYQFFVDADKDNTGTVTMKEYIDYATSLSNLNVPVQKSAKT